MNTESLLNNLVTAVIVIDKSLTLRYANAATEQLLALSSYRITGTQLSELIHSIAVDVDIFKSAIEQNQSLTVNTAQLSTLDGQLHTVDITLIPFESSDTGDTLGLLELRQVDQQRRIHHQLSQDAQQQAAQFLVRNLAHEIKNPLSGLRGAAQLLSRELTDPQLNDFTNMIIEQADRLRALVDRLLGPQKPSRHQRQNIHLVIQKVLTLVNVGLPQQIKLHQDYDPSIPELLMDEDQIQQVILNILNNAVQALEPIGGNITIKTRTAHRVTLGTHTHKLVLILSIIDNGPGVAPELLNTLFYPMVTGRAEGHGLGLSIAHNITRQHGGRIDCDSVAGHTEFSITLPIHALEEIK